MYCDATTISSRTLIGGGSLDCRTGCIGTLASLTYYCTDYSVSEDWSSGEKTTIYNMGTVTYFEASYVLRMICNSRIYVAITLK